MKTSVGADPGLATFGLSCVSEDGGTYALERCEVFRSANQEDLPFATNIAMRTQALFDWFDAQFWEIEKSRLREDVRSITAERFEFLRSSVSASELAAGHAALVSFLRSCKDEYSYETAIPNLPDYPSAKEVKRAVTGCSFASKKVVECAVRQVVRGAAERLDEMLKGDREHAADSIAVALHSLGCRTPPIVVVDSRRDIPEGIVHDPIIEGVHALSENGRALIVLGQIARHHAQIPYIDESAWMEWTDLAGTACATRDRRNMYAFVPSPAEKPEWWAVKKNADKARRFLATALKE